VVIHRDTQPGMFWNVIFVAAAFMLFCIVMCVRRDPADPK
jgi:hypothetical protein